MLIHEDTMTLTGTSASHTEMNEEESKSAIEPPYLQLTTTETYADYSALESKKHLSKGRGD